MKIIYYPNLIDKEGGTGPISRFFKNLKKERPPILWTMVQATLEKVEKSSNLNDLIRQGWVEHMSFSSAPIYEFKIPPKKRKGGVTRLYFAYKKNDSNTIVILSAEKKHGKIKADRGKVKQAEQRYNEVCR